MTKLHFPQRLVIFALLSLAIPMAFIAFHLLTPSDGARLAESKPDFEAQGVVIAPYDDSAGGLFEGDIVLAVDGLSMEAIAADLFRISVERPRWNFGRPVTYALDRDGRQVEVDLRLGRLPVGAILADRWGVLLFALVSQLVAGFVIIKRTEDPAARALFIWAMSGGHTYAWSVSLQVGDLVSGLGFWLYRLATPGLWLIYWPAALHVALVFPRPRPITRRFPALIPAIYAFSFLLFGAILAGRWISSAGMLPWLDSWGPAENLVAGLYLAATVVAVLYLYRFRWGAAEREQIRWAVYGVGLSGGAGLLLWLGAPALLGRSIISANVLGLAMLPFPISLAIAIWRHQLFDIDLIIRRTLVYALLTGTLAIVYFGGVILFQLILPAQSSFGVVVSTLAIAGLFSPLRRRIQTVIDRRFYRKEYDAEQILASFGSAMREEVDLDRISGYLVEAVDRSLRPETVSLWVRRNPGVQAGSEDRS